MTKVLLISNKSDLTSDFVVKKLKEGGVSFYRLNTEELTRSIFVSLDFKSDRYTLFDNNTNQELNLKEFSSVYYRRPELPDISYLNLSKGESNFIRSEILYTLEGIYKVIAKAYWVSPLYAIREAENKIYQIILSKSIGLMIPESLISNSYETVQQFYQANNENCIIKPIKSGLIESDDKEEIIFTSRLSSAPSTSSQIESCPVYMQPHIKKKGDIRATVVGNTIFATLIESQNFIETETDWRRGERVLKHLKIELPVEIQNKCIELVKSLGLRFGAIDFILDVTGNYIFLEINPNGQWAWIERQTGYAITNEIVNLLIHENF